MEENCPIVDSLGNVVHFVNGFVSLIIVTSVLVIKETFILYSLKISTKEEVAHTNVAKNLK